VLRVSSGPWLPHPAWRHPVHRLRQREVTSLGRLHPYDLLTIQHRSHHTRTILQHIWNTTPKPYPAGSDLSRWSLYWPLYRSIVVSVLWRLWGEEPLMYTCSFPLQE
jgi:hypothetical protein